MSPPLTAKMDYSTARASCAAGTLHHTTVPHSPHTLYCTTAPFHPKFAHYPGRISVPI